ncbi:MAG: LPS-assembly protein [Parasphingorhabdus sp.]|jgi:LPS-assembly protein
MSYSKAISRTGTKAFKGMQYSGKQRSVTTLMIRSAGISALTMGLVVFSSPALANQDSLFFASEEFCPADVIDIPQVMLDAMGMDSSSQEIVLESDSIDAPDANTIELTGNAQIVQGSQGVFANKIVYSKDSYSLNALDNITLYTPGGDRLNMESLSLVMDTMIGEADKVSFQMAKRDHGFIGKRDTLDFGGTRHGSDLGETKDSTWGTNWNSFDSVTKVKKAQIEGQAITGTEGEQMAQKSAVTEVHTNMRGEADKIFFEGVDRQRLTRASITSCRAGQDSVYIKASELVLDHATGVGVGTNMSVRFFGVPIFYFPKASFPINGERKTGFLFPSVGSIEDSGTVVEVPYYINIAENKDATVTMRYLSDRGVQIRGEYRYMGENYDGIFRGEVLPGDDVFGDDRDAFSFDHRQRFGVDNNWEATVDVQDVSDTEYLDDFANSVGLSSTSFLDQRARVRYAGEIFNFDADVKDYVTVDSTLNEERQPYARLPRVRFSAENPLGMLDPVKFGIETELVNFDHPTNTRVSGTRLDATPYVSLPLEAVYGYVTPKVSLRHTQYSLDNVDPGDPDNPSRSIPVFSVDSGIAFERPTTWGGTEHYQTLEPRLYYVYASEENQDDMPVFDTGGGNLDNIGNFFRDNRFFGADRVEDANRVSLGVTTRIIDANTGQERLKAEIAQLFYLDDRFVSLSDNDEPEIEDKSDLLANVRAYVNDQWEVGSSVRYSAEDSETDSFRLDTQYRRDDRRKIGFDYRYDSDSSEQVSMDAYWPLANKWQLSLTDIYDLEEGENLSMTWGLTYDACCWAFRLSGEQRRNRDGQDESSVFFTLELKDLGKFSSVLSTPPQN